MSESEKSGETGFRVVDKRRFDADGAERDESPQEGGTTPENSAGDPATDPATDPAAAGADSAAEARSEPGGADEVSGLAHGFSALVGILSTQALLCLGEIPDSSGSQPEVDLVGGRHFIDLLRVVEAKTRGNLTAEEAALLKEALYDLRMRFVELSRSDKPSNPS